MAEAQDIEHVLVAGDVYDNDAPSPKTLREPLERMRDFPKVKWHLLPGNHDPHRSKGVWDRVQESGQPANVHIHLEPKPFDLGGNAVLLPAPLTRKSEGRDLTEWMDQEDTPGASIRIGMAHGSVTDFGTDGESQNPIAPTRPETARLDYLALGDWHGTVQVGPACWYSGTPEPDRAGSQEYGTALVVEMDGASHPPKVSRHTVGSYRWLTINEQFDDLSDLADFERNIRSLPDCSAIVLRLVLTGALTLSGLSDLRQRLAGLDAALLHLESNEEKLYVSPSESDLEAIDFGGVLREAADELLALSQDDSLTRSERQMAESGLVELFVRTTSEERSRSASA